MLSGLVGILYAIALVLVILWVIGLVLKVTFVGIHLLLVIAIILIAYNLLVGSRRGAQ